MQSEPMFRFDVGTHAYSLNGHRLPSVTQVMAHVGLGLPANVPAEVLEQARRRGIIVHQLCAAIDRGETISDDHEYVDLVDGYRRFCREALWQVIATERPIYHPTLGYAGTPDVYGYLNAVGAVIDRKATYTLHPDTAVQAAGYALILQERKGPDWYGMLGRAGERKRPQIEVIAGLHLRADSYRLQRYDLATATNVFLACVGLYNGKDVTTARAIIDDWIRSSR